MPGKCCICREHARWGRVCDECRKTTVPTSKSPSSSKPRPLADPIDAAPFIAWLERQHDPTALIARRAEVGDDWLRKGAFHRSGLIERRQVEDVLHANETFYWEVYDEPFEPEPEPKVDARGRDATRPRGVSRRLSDSQVEAAYRIHVEAGISMRELGRLGWEQWGYANADSAARALGVAFAGMGLEARDRIEATVKASTVHGKASRVAARSGDPVYLEHRRAVRRASGEVRGVLCRAVRTQYPRAAHDPARAAAREAHLAQARRLAA